MKKKTVLTGSLLTVLLLVAQAAGQSVTPPESGAGNSPAVTISVTEVGVRFAGLGSIGQMRLEVFGSDGQTIYNSEFQSGSVRDWGLADKGGQRVADGTYLCVITIRDLAGKLHTKQGTVVLQNGRAGLQMEGAASGNIEAEKALTPVVDREAAVTLVGHDGRNGQLVSTRGGFSFRSGDFFGGQDQELMRLRRLENAADGTARARLEIAGTVRAAQGIEFADGTVQTSGISGRVDAQGNIVPDASGTGSAGRLAKWVDGAGTLGDSLLSESGSNIVNNGASIQMTAAASTSVDTNLIFVNGNDRTTGVIASSTPSFTSANGPYFAMRGNTYSAFAGQRGLFAISAGDVTSPTGREGSVIFNTGPDQIRMIVSSNGNVGVGTTTPQSLLDVNGNLNVAGNATVAGNIAAKYQDIAEWTAARGEVPAGTVVSLDRERANTVRPSPRAYDTRVAGVVSGQPGVILGEGGANRALVATTGRVKVRVSAERAPIRIGDLLVTSKMPGVAMKSAALRVRGRMIHRPGTIIGKALEPLAKGHGEILVLLTLQ
jgi:hypothetical protein